MGRIWLADSHDEETLESADGRSRHDPRRGGRGGLVASSSSGAFGDDCLPEGARRTTFRRDADGKSSAGRNSRRDRVSLGALAQLEMAVEHPEQALAAMKRGRTGL